MFWDRSDPFESHEGWVVVVNMSALQYKQLNAKRKTVRLLRVLPICRYNTIQCKLHHVDLDDKPRFVALSYTWDSQSVHSTTEAEQ
jgi:hypothetical protein